MPTAIVSKRSKPTIELTRHETVLPELEKLSRENNGILLAERVVQAAEPEDSPLHKYFQWDDTEAAHQYRLFQARQLINAVVTIIPNYKRPVGVFISLRTDRSDHGGGYRALVDVLSIEEQRQQMLEEALDDLHTWERKYHVLTELAEIFQAANKVRARSRRGTAGPGRVR